MSLWQRFRGWLPPTAGRVEWRLGVLQRRVDELAAQNESLRLELDLVREALGRIEARQVAA